MCRNEPKLLLFESIYFCHFNHLPRLLTTSIHLQRRLSMLNHIAASRCCQNLGPIEDHSVILWVNPTLASLHTILDSTLISALSSFL